MLNKSFSQLGPIPFPSKSLPHTASCTSSTTLPENKISVGILNRHKFHRRADTGSQLNYMNWLDCSQSHLFSNEGEQLFMCRTVVNRAACRRLATREKAVSEGPVIGLFRRETEAGQSTCLHSVLLQEDSKQHHTYISVCRSDALGLKED